MKKIVKLSGLISLVTVLLTACGAPEPHTHTWGSWRQSATEHWRVCTAKGCTSPVAEERGTHTGHPCSVCGPNFKVVAFYTGINDQAHVSFVNEANEWFADTATSYNFTYNSTNDWRNLNDEYLAEYDLVLFLDTRPEEETQRAAFQRYMEGGGAWIGFHFSAFALTPSSYNQDWDWYHDEFLGSGEYVSNTWEPTTAVLKVETHDHPATENLPDTFTSTPCEWYRWEHDLRENPDITILASIDPSSFPLGTGPNPNEIWHSGYYPVVWSNNNYNMMYLNMGHNLMNYSTNETLSYTFSNEIQNRMILDAMFGLV